MVTSKAIPEKAGSLSRDKYMPGNSVLMDQYVVKTPGRLPEGYGRERDCNKFHGETIFRDAASKIIHVENQVSLGAGETVMAKLFLTFLWVNKDTSEVSMVTPALGPSFGVAPSGTCICTL
mgnify:CR=1 FL=1